MQLRMYEASHKHVTVFYGTKTVTSDLEHQKKTCIEKSNSEETNQLVFH